MKTCSKNCLQVIDVAEIIDDNKTSVFIKHTQDLPPNPADEKPYDDTIDGHLAQERSDQFWDDDTIITNDITGRIFTSKVPINGNDKWTEEWVIEDEQTLKDAKNGSNAEIQFQYNGTTSTSASYITALEGSPAAATAVSMSVDFYYETFDMNASPVKDLPTGIPNSLDQVTFKVYSAKIDVAGAITDKHHTGWLLRLHREETAGLLHADHWVLYSEYELPSSTDMVTILEEAGLNHTSAWHFCDDAAQNLPDTKDGTAKQTAKWFVRTQAVYQSI